MQHIPSYNSYIVKLQPSSHIDYNIKKTLKKLGYMGGPQLPAPF